MEAAVISRRLLTWVILWGMTQLIFPRQLAGQQVPQYALGAFHRALMYPAAAGSGEFLELTVGTRSQWNGLPGQPVGYFAMAQLPLPFLSSGVGLIAHRDRVGYLEQTELSAQYAQALDMGPLRLRIGVEAGLLQAGIRGELLRTPEGDYPVDAPPIHRDAVLPVGTALGSRAVLHAGLLAEAGAFQGGLSIRHLQGGGLRFSDGGPSTGIGLRPQAMAFLSYSINSGSLEIRPELGVIADKAILQSDMKCQFSWRSKAMLGIGFRGWGQNSFDALLWQGGVWISERFLLAVTYESGLSGLRAAHSGGFELLLRYSLDPWAGKGRLPGRVYNPRFL